MSNDVKMLEPLISNELLGYTLNLARPELAELMSRYVPSNPHTPAQLLGPPSAVIVTRWPGQELPIKNELENDGWSVEVCDGPGRKVCPLMGGRPCALRSNADAAIVFMSPAEDMPSTPRVRCAADPSSPGVVALEGRVDPPRFSGTTAVVGAMQEPNAVVSAVSELLVDGWTPGEF